MKKGIGPFPLRRERPFRDGDRERESTTEKEIRRASPITVPCK